MVVTAETNQVVYAGVNGFSHESESNGLIPAPLSLPVSGDIVTFPVVQTPGESIQAPKKPRFSITSGMLAKLKVDDQRAWEDFVVQSSPHVVRLIRSRGVPEQDTPSVENAFYDRLHQGIASIRYDGNPIANFKANIRSRCADYHKGRYKDRNIESLNSPLPTGKNRTIIEEDVASPDPNPEDLVLAQEGLRRVKRALGCLSDNEQEILGLAIKGLKGEAIGFELGKSESTARNLLQKARRKLQQLLDEQDKIAEGGMKDEGRKVPVNERQVSKEELWERIIYLEIEEPKDLDTLLNPEIDL